MLEYIIIGLLIVLIILISVTIYILLKKKETNYDKDQFHDFNLKQQENLHQTTNEIRNQSYQLKEDLNNLFSTTEIKNTKELSEFKEKLYQSIERNIQLINEKVENRLTKGFETTQEVFNKVIKQLTIVNEAQKQMEKLSTDVISLNHLLSDKKTRGIFGETQLYHILENVFGKSSLLYETQKTLSNKNIVDALIYMPEGHGNIPVDSKFPLENYKKMLDKTIDIVTQQEGEKLFKQDIKKHIDDISSKYLIVNETAKFALMFVPSEAIFSEIADRHDDLVNYAQKKNVWLTSPNTLIYMLTTLQIIIKDLERNKHAESMIKEVEKLGVEFKRLKERWEGIKTTSNTLNKRINEMDITTNKIVTSFEKTYDISFEIPIEEE